MKHQAMQGGEQLAHLPCKLQTHGFLGKHTRCPPLCTAWRLGILLQAADSDLQVGHVAPNCERQQVARAPALQVSNSQLARQRVRVPTKQGEGEGLLLLGVELSLACPLAHVKKDPLKLREPLVPPGCLATLWIIHFSLSPLNKY